MITIQDIKGYKLFSGLDENELKEIAGLCRRKTYDSGTILFDPHNPSEDLFLVEEGNDAIQIRTTLGNNEGNIVIHNLSKGETFGWTALGPQHIKVATAICVEQVNVIAINWNSLMQLLEKNNHTGYIVMKNLADIISTRLSYTTLAFRREIRELKKMVTAASTS
jgi:signal-transduction protein with cAMP-binding, CBS, and nucleotidyltransferase domain